MKKLLLIIVLIIATAAIAAAQNDNHSQRDVIFLKSGSTVTLHDNYLSSGVETTAEGYLKKTYNDNEAKGVGPLIMASVYANAAADQLAAEAAIEAIDAIGTVVYTDACKAKIDAARAAYNALPAAQKALVTNYAVLTAAEADYAALEAAAQQTAAVDAAEAKISAIGTVAYTDASRAKIDEARAAYDALTAEQKALVTKADDLTAAEDALADLKAAGQNDDADNNGGSEGTKTSLWQKILAFFRKIIDFFRNLFK